ncbi:MAG: hypothetical protein WCJ61_10805, partial [Paludibacter sp.]
MQIYKDVYDKYKKSIDDIGFNQLDKLEPILADLKATGGNTYTSLFRGNFSGSLEYFNLDCPAGE